MERKYLKMSKSDGKTRYVVVFNDHGVRNIVTYYGYKGEADFWAWYYKEYVMMPGDRMCAFAAMENAINLAGRIDYGRK